MSYGSNPRITGTDRQALANRLADLYRAGLSIRAIARREYRSYGNVHGLLTEAGVTLRTRGGDTRSAEAAARRLKTR